MQSSAKTCSRLLSVHETAAYIKMSKSWLDKQRLLGGFAPYVKIGRRVFYDIADLDEALKGAKRNSTSDCQEVG
jgi:predicted DNA-binding transcriptional regulator AlpA